MPGSGLHSPYVFYETCDYQNNIIRISFTFDENTRVLQTCTVYRDAACVYKKLYIGLGVDGGVDSSVRKVNVPSGTTNVPVAVLSSFGFSTIESIVALQITAGP